MLIKRQRRHSNRWLQPGFLAAHDIFCLMLLPSGPDMVHRLPLHKTRPSTLLIAAHSSISRPKKRIQLCYSGLQIQGTASSPPGTANGSLPQPGPMESENNIPPQKWKVNCFTNLYISLPILFIIFINPLFRPCCIFAQLRVFILRQGRQKLHIF